MSHVLPLRLVLCSVVVLGLSSCKIDLHIFGNDEDDKVVALSGNFDCSNNTDPEASDNGDCTQQYVNTIAECDGYEIGDEWIDLPNCTLVGEEETHTDILVAIPDDGNEFAGWANFCWVGASLCTFDVTGTDAADTGTAEVEASFGTEAATQDAQYTYNHLGQRQSKTVDSVTTYFVYDPNGQLIGEYDSSGATIREYVYLEGKLLAQYDYSTSATAPEMNYYVNDHLGTPMFMVNREPEQTYDLETGPFGERYGEFKVAGLTQNVRFPGQYYDSETGYSYNWNRDYDPSIGRYLQSDPIGLMGGINTYGYALQNPVMHTDPTGQSAAGLLSNPLVWGLVAAAAPTVIQSLKDIGNAIGDAYNNNSSDNTDDNSSDDASDNSTDDNGKTCPTNKPRGNPFTGDPGSTSTSNGGDTRKYGDDGYPETDYDAPHPNEGSPGNEDHVHNWDRPADGGPPTHEDRGPPTPYSPLP